MTHVLRQIGKTVALAAVLALGAAGSGAAPDDPAAVAKYRILLMKTQTGHLRAIAAVVKGEVSYGAHVKYHAEAIREIGEMVGQVFPEGSAVADSRAKPEIWQNWDKFQKLYANYKIQIAKLAEVAATGDMGAIGARLDEVGKACSACHKPFRKEKEKE